MKSIKSHVKAIHKYENQVGMFDLLVTYFLKKNSSIASAFCEAEYYLPSFILLKKLKGKYSNLCTEDDELNNLFNSAIECSKLFYSQAINIVKKDGANNDKYESSFENQAQPMGQQLINLLANIKYRIRIVRLKKTREEASSKRSLAYFLFYYFQGLLSIVNNLIYKVTLFASSNLTAARRVYFSTILGTILVFWLINFLFLNSFSPISSAFINVFVGIGVVLLAIATYPLGDFGKKDISGRNIVAYKYKVFLIDKGNAKLVNVFKLQQGRSDASRAI